MMRGADVAQLQKLLGIAPDGVFGMDTDIAVSSFQNKSGLKVDGVVGPATLAKLKP
jgi:peptidoglycan hydrolase-like protein with peptidoglycan-binding domain